MGCLSNELQLLIVMMDHRKDCLEYDAYIEANDELHQRKLMSAAVVAMEVRTFICLRTSNASASACKREELGRKVCAAREGANHHCDLAR